MSQCTCPKVRYPSRSAAKKAAKRIYPGDHLSAYRCGGSWHIGHLAPYVLSGEGPRAHRAAP